MNTKHLLIPIALALTFSNAWSADDADVIKKDIEQRTVLEPELTNKIPSNDSSDLMNELSDDGLVRVIVDLDTGLEANATLDNKSSEEDIKSISAIQDRVINGVLEAQESGKFDTAVRKYVNLPSFAITVDSEGLKTLAKDPNVKGIHIDRIKLQQLHKSVPLIGMSGDKGGYALGATGQGYAVAVLDSGVQSNHPFLNGKVIAEACFSNSSGLHTSLCPNGNKTQLGTGSAESTTTACRDGSDNLCSHGTHVSGIAAGNNPIPGDPPSGVAKDSKIIAVQIFTRSDNSTTCDGIAYTPCIFAYTSDELAGLDWVISNINSLPSGIKLGSVNMSIGGGRYSSYCDSEPEKPLIDRLRNSGVATAIAAGNEYYVNAVSSPACISSAITVGATKIDDTLSLISNESKLMIDLMAPGEYIYSSVPTNSYASKRGTSMAAPHVAGAFAAIKSRLPSASVSQIESALKDTGIPIWSYSKEYTKPRIQVQSALNKLGVIPSFRITVTKNGPGTITSSPTGIDCGSICSSNQFTNGTSVSLIAKPDNGYYFKGWDGACTSTNECVINLDSDKTITATFVQLPRLNVFKTGAGTITSTPAGISCGATCSNTFQVGSTVSLNAQPDYGHALSGWEGTCNSTGVCTVTMDTDKSVVANFYELPKYPVIINKSGTGVVNSEPAGILCGGINKQCLGSFFSVKLTAKANDGYEFINWVGCSRPEGNVCKIDPTGKVIMKAVFKKLPKYKLKITKNTLGSITSSNGYLNCPDKKKICMLNLSKGTEVTLTPVPQAGKSFSGWNGACSGVNVCVLRMDGPKNITALFE